MTKTCLMIGACIAGLTAALALTTANSKAKCMVYELRDSPSAIGRVVNLTPNALRLLASFGVCPKGCPVDSIELFSIHTGSKIGELPFQKSGGALRVLREELQRALLLAVKDKRLKVVFGYKFLSAEQHGADVVVKFENETEAKANFVLGCDDMHSAVRMAVVDPERLPIYTGVAVAYSVFSAEGISTHFKSTALNQGRFGSLMTTYVDPERNFMSAGAVMETRPPGYGDMEGWKERGKDPAETMKEIRRRFETSNIPCLMGIISRMGEPILFPVYKLEQGGQWAKGKIMLLGDAAHGMPPQGESTGLAIKDVILFARIFAKFEKYGIFQVHENTRRPRINAAYEEAIARWENARDNGWIEQKIAEFFTGWWLWWKKGVFEANFACDVRTVELIN